MKPDQYLLDKMAKDPKNWRGPFYGCSRDPRLFVPKLDPSVGYGWTPNLLNPFTYLVLFGIVVITVAYHYLR